MMSQCGYHGRYLEIRLGAAGAPVFRDVPLPEDLLRTYLGGSGLGTKILLDRLQSGEVDDDDPIAFVFSPLVGSSLTTSAKFAVVCKSPLTGRLNDALASSGFAISGKATGFDAIVLSGREDQPTVVVIDDGDVRLEPALDLWGRTTTETEAALRVRYGSEFDFAVIGPAGEQGVRYASISHDGRHAGRGGAGTVLGRKRIKAIAVRGSHSCRWHDLQGLNRYSKALSRKSFGPATAKYRELGTAANLLAFNRLRTLPTRNFQQAAFDQAEKIAPETLQQTRAKTRASCRACTIGCEHLYQLDETPGTVRLEYENLFALGPLCGIGDAEAVLQASKLCDELGIDTISTGGTIAFAMECVERGLLQEPWLQFGDATALLKAIPLIAARKGIGAQLAEGSRALAEQLGGEAGKFAIHVKGLELPGYEPRTLQAMALGLAVSTRGADHNRSSAYEVDFSGRAAADGGADRMVRSVIDAEDRSTLLDSLILCKFLRGALDDVWKESTQMLRMVTGWDLDSEELRDNVRRIVSTKKRFNIHCGWSPEEDTLPARFFDDALPDPPDAAFSGKPLTRERHAELVREYNRERGWTADGYVVNAEHIG